MATAGKTARRRVRDVPHVPGVPGVPQVPGVPNVPGVPGVPGVPHARRHTAMRSAMVSTSTAARATEAPSRPAPQPTGETILSIARQHIGEQYILGARAPLSNGQWKGPWDCAEFTSWCVYQASGVLFGVRPQHDPVLADAYTGFWADQARAAGATVPIEEAARIPGACLLRFPATGKIGHIAFADGEGGTVEAHSTARGVSAHQISGRRWDCGVLVPGISYFRSETPIRIREAPPVMRLTTPMTRGDKVLAVQKRLAALGYHPGALDGVFGPQTESAVAMFQADKGIVPDGEVGPATLKALQLQ